MMILLEAGLFNLLLKVRIISQIENGNALLSCYLTESTCRKHFKILIDSGYTKTTVIADPIFAANALFSGDFITPEAPRDPYWAVSEASFKMVKLSISVG